MREFVKWSSRLGTPDANDIESASQIDSPVKSEESCEESSPRARSSAAATNKDSLNESDVDETLGAIPKIKSPVSRISYDSEEHPFPVTPTTQIGILADPPYSYNSQI